MAKEEVFNIFPYFDLGEIEMRQIVHEDVESFYNYITHKAVTKFLAESDIPDSLDNARKELLYWGRLHSLRSSVYWAIGLKGGQIVGTGGFNYWNQSQRRTEISYDIDYNYWGRGFATAVVKAMVEFAFSKMQVKRVQATVAVHNVASIRVLEKAGFEQEGVLRNYGVLEGDSRDFYMYSQVQA